MSTLKLADGIRFKDGIDFSDGIDLEGKGLSRRFPKAAKRTREAVMPPVTGHRAAPKSDSGRIYAGTDRSYSKWTTTVIYGNYDTDGNSRPAHKAQSVAPNRHVQRYLALSARGYGRRCIVRIQYTEGKVRPGAGRRLASFAGTSKITTQREYNMGNIGYIGRKEATLAGPEEDRPEEGKTLFTCDGGQKIALSTKEAGLLMGKGDVFTVVISPEDKEFDPVALAENFLEKFARHCYIMEKETGRKKFGAPSMLKWVGAVHRNTDHTHIHLMIGRDTQKGKLRLGKPYMKEGARRDCEQILTDLMGERSWDEELEQARQKALRTRFTSVDAMIIRMAGKDRQIGKWSIENRDDHNATLIEKRLEQLRRWRLASYSKKTASWSISPEYEPTLEKFEILSGLGMDPESEGFVVDRRDSDYRGKVVKAEREDEGNTVFLLVHGEDGLRHLRKEIIEEGDEVVPPEGMVNASEIKALMRRAALAGREGRTK